MPMEATGEEVEAVEMGVGVSAVETEEEVTGVEVLEAGREVETVGVETVGVGVGEMDSQRPSCLAIRIQTPLT